MCHIRSTAASPVNPEPGDPLRGAAARLVEKEFLIDNLLARIRFIIVMIRWTGSLTSTPPAAGEPLRGAAARLVLGERPAHGCAPGPDPDVGGGDQIHPGKARTNG